MAFINFTEMASVIYCVHNFAREGNFVGAFETGI
jgi:hypothetical protein